MSGTIAVELDEGRVDAIFAELDHCQLPGVAVGIGVRGTPVYRKGFGLANLELPVALSPSIRMRIGSVTKHFTAFAYLRLCEMGKARIDDRVGDYLPELHPVTHAVTMRQLMGNISGLRDVCDIRFQFSGVGGRAVPATELLAMYREIDDVNAAPGTTWIYNNGGWLILSAVIERITGQSLEDVFRDLIFTPVGMHDTLLRRWDTDFVANSAMTHTLKTGGGLEFERTYYGLDFAGAGAVVSTIDDMLRWLAHMGAPRVGSAETWRVMRTPQRLANGTSTGYALGLLASEYRGVEVLHHAGGWTGGNAQMLKVPAAELDVIVIVNRNDVVSITLAERIIDACLPQLAPPRKPASRPLAAGTFRSRTTGRVLQLFGREGQQFACVDGQDMLVEPDDQGVLWASGIYALFRKSFALSGDGVRFSDFGNVDELLPVEPVEGTGAIAGRYRSETTHTDALIHEVPEGLRLHSFGRFGSAEFGLECLTKGVWRAHPTTAILPPGGVLSFDEDGSFRFSNSMTHSLHFRRT
jgi:D-aminopeptidase